MGLFRKKDRVIDLSERYRKQQARAEEIKQESQNLPKNNSEGFGFFGAIANTVSKNNEDNSEYVDMPAVDERRKKLAKRLMDMTEKIEDMSNQIYHLQQRIEVLERKAGVKGF